MYKKIILVLLCIFIVYCLLVQKREEKVSSVFLESDYNYYVYNIDVSNSEITTKNINKKFSNYTILSINPYINPIYEKLINIKTYNFDNNKTIGSNINEFNEIYIDELRDKSLDNEALKLSYSGIKINQICIYVTKRELEQILMDKKIKIIK